MLREYFRLARPFLVLLAIFALGRWVMGITENFAPADVRIAGSYGRQFVGPARECGGTERRVRT